MTTRRANASNLVGVCAAFLLACDATAKPNVVLVLADDIGWASVGYNGARFCETPNIDRLAEDGMRLNRFYPGGPNGGQARACLMTGMYSPRHKLYQTGGRSRGNRQRMRWKVPSHGDESYDTFETRNNRIDGEWESIAEILARAGYETARIGKWQLGPDPQGFKLSTPDGVHPDGRGASRRLYRDLDVADQMTRCAIRFITENRAKPFFLYFSLWEAHAPLVAEPEISRKYEYKVRVSGGSPPAVNPAYAAEVEVADRNVGLLRNAIERLGLSDNTLFIFASDNGGVLSSTDNAPLRAGKGSLFEGGIRTPLALAWPGVVAPGSSSDQPVSGIDVLPTLAEIAEAPLPENQPVDGVSIVPLMRGGSLGKRSIFLHYPLYLPARGRAKALAIFGTDEPHWRAVPASAIIRGEWKLIHYYEYDEHQLFNLAEDVSELDNLADSEPEVAKELSNLLMRWVQETGAPTPNVPNPAFQQE